MADRRWILEEYNYSCSLFTDNDRQQLIFIEVEIKKTGNRIVFRFKDGGEPFNPLEQEMPDPKLSWKLRRIGGLGIFLVIKKMDDVRYAYEDNKNVLTIEKVIKDLSVQESLPSHEPPYPV